MCIVCAMYAVCYMYCVCCMCCIYDIYYRICVLHVLSIECNIMHIVCMLCVLHGYIHLCLFILMCAFATLSGYEYDSKRKTEKKKFDIHIHFPTSNIKPLFRKQSNLYANFISS